MPTEEQILEIQRRVREIFDEVVELSPEERSNRLVSLKDPRVRSAVTALLEWDAPEHSSFLDRPLTLPPGSLATPSYKGLRIGPYVLGDLLGEGGTGMVYQGHREDGQFEQQVAVKLIRADLATPIAQRRFRAEQQILATLDHPNIAKLLDGGTTAEGVPYVVLELVDGLPLTDYCDQGNLDLRDRLELFRTVCASVHYAHRHLVVHRDLKPSNILVTREGEPKLLDFGIAKLLDSANGLEDRTETEYRALTPAYASPEQLVGKPITTASDTYSLGVILYELVSGLRPYQRGTDTPAQLAERLSKAPPPAPSHALGVADPDTATRLAECRGMARREHRHRLEGDLDRVVAMAMTAEPDGRYGSADQLSEDVDRYLRGLPVVAQPATLWYRSRKFLRRHQVGMVVTSLFLLLIVGFSGVTLVQSVRLREQRDAALEARRLAEQERKRAEAVTEFLRQSFVLADPGETRGEALTAREVLDSGSRRVRDQLSGQPGLQASLLGVLADVYVGLGYYDVAGSLAEDSVELGRSLGNANQLAEALELLGAARLYQQRFEDAEQTFRESYSLRVDQAGAEDVSATTSLFYLAYLHKWQGRQVEAEETARRVLELRQRARAAGEPVGESDLADSLYMIGEVLTTSEDPSRAESPLRRALDEYQQLGSGYERKVVATHHALAKTLDAVGRAAEALESMNSAIELSREILGRHPMLADELISSAGFLRRQGHWEAGEAALREAIEIYREVGGDDDDLVIAGLVHLGYLLLQKPDLTAAQDPLEEALQRSRRTLEGSDPRHASILSNLISLYVRQMKLPEADRHCREAIPLRRRLLAEGSDTPARLTAGLANSLLLCGETQALSGDLVGGRQAIEESRSLFAQVETTWRLAVADSVLGSIVSKQGDRKTAEKLLTSSLERLREERPGTHYEDAAARRLALHLGS